MKARRGSSRWLPTMGTGGWIAAALCSALGGQADATSPAVVEPVAHEPEPVAHEPEPEPTRASAPEPDSGRHARPEPDARRNAIVLGTHAMIPNWATSLGYQRALGQRFSVGAGLEYGYQARGYWHLQGVGETLSGQVWLGRTFHGVFAEASLTVAHQFLVQQPRLSITAVVPGLGLGFRWTHRSGLTLGASGGLRWGRRVATSSIICTRSKHCTSIREGTYARITADVGFVF